jgi:hypothetical protein
MSKKDKFLWWALEKFFSFKETVREFPEIFGIPLILIAFYFSPHILYYIDPTAAVWDWGTVQTLIPVTAIGLTINCLAFIGFKLNYPVLYKRFLTLEYTKATVWQVTIFSFYVISKYILMFLLITLALLT